MSSLMRILGRGISGALVLIAFGCSDARMSESQINSDTGKHLPLWMTSELHGAVAKAAATSTTGFASCQECHGEDFIGGISVSTCLNTAGCHGVGIQAPHSPAPWRNGSRTHTNTDTSNAPICAQCHTNGANSTIHPLLFDPGAAPGCFNNTLCHAGAGHPAGWEDPDSHGAIAKSTPGTATGFNACQACHGNDFAGGAVLQTCLNTAGCHGVGVQAPHSPAPWKNGTRTHTNTDTNNAAVCAQCHTNGANSTVQPSPFDPLATPGCFNNTLCHADVGTTHAVPFTDPALHGPSAKADLTYCQACHASPSDGGAGSNPRFNVPKGGLTNGCEDCHAANSSHAVPWSGANATSHQSAGNMATACALCHGAALDGGAGPACSTCHTVGSPLTLLNCTSCHGKPPTGAIFPNVAGKHGKHDALENVNGICNTCHNGSGSETANHNNAVVNMAFVTSYNAKSGTATFNGSGCSNVGCHGGQTTPGTWLTGAIDVNNQCTSCHASGSSQYNSYNSGDHSKHMGPDVGAVCADCHDTVKLAGVHFNDLNTTQMTQGSQTINGTLNYNGSSCTFTCHVGNKSHDSGWTW